MFIKVCGMRSTADIDAAAGLGYTAAGIVLHPASPRYVEPGAAIELALSCKGRILSAAVAMNRSQIEAVEKYFDLIQVYELFDDPRLIYAGADPPPEGSVYRYFMRDTSMGRGEFTQSPVYDESLRKRLLISGGLTPENVREAIEASGPAGVDVSSGVERVRGLKDYGLMEQFIYRVREIRPRGPVDAAN